MSVMLLGLTGPARSGKDTVADILVASHKFEKYSLASPIKGFFDKLFNWDEQHRDGALKEIVCRANCEINVLRACLEAFFPTEKYDELLIKFNSVFDPYKTFNGNYDISPRVAYQLFGTEFGRSISNTIWLDLAKLKLSSLDNPFPDPTYPYKIKGLVVPDIRFQNEADWILSSGGTLIHIERDNVVQVAKHSSESGIPVTDGDIVLHNSGDISQLATAVSQLFMTPTQLDLLQETKELFLEYF